MSSATPTERTGKMPANRKTAAVEAAARNGTARDATRDRNKIERLCGQRGLRMTGPRRIIARIIAEAQDHPDVVELHRRATVDDPNISLSTVYRTVKLFEDQGIIERHQFGDGRARYESAPSEHHDHLIDMNTGAVIEFQSDEIEALQAEIARKLGYRLVHHRLELYALPLDDKSK